MNKQQEQQIRAVISATSEALVSSALHMSITYNSKDLFKCINKMTDEEWEAWSNQPAPVKGAYLQIMDAQRDPRELTQMAFEARINKQENEVASLIA